MRIWSTILGPSISLALILAAAPARAQDEDSEEPPLGDVDEGGGDEGAPTPAASAGGDASGEPPSATETHTVSPNDTLWDLCSKYLNSPWYWPKIWSYNPQITNPHWIYPGNEIRFYPSDEQLPTNVEVARAIEAPDADSDDSRETLDADEMVRTSGQIEVGRVAPNSVWTSYMGFVTKTSHDQAGEIINAESEAVMLADYDRTYVKLKQAAKKGDRYAVYRVIREIEHPVTGDVIGYAIEIVGGIQVVDTSPTVATAQIAQAFRPVERGDYVGAWPEQFGSRVGPTPNGSETQGYIVETVGDDLGPLGEHHLVFIDRGSSHGVVRGNVFTVVDRGDGFTRETQGLPNEDVGQLMVVDVQDGASTAIVTYSLRELAVGDKIEMRKGN
jgi:hypothetical protein